VAWPQSSQGTTPVGACAFAVIMPGVVAIIRRRAALALPVHPSIHLGSFFVRVATRLSGERTGHVRCYPLKITHVERTTSHDEEMAS
jgi:hypothetical protein